MAIVPKIFSEKNNSYRTNDINHEKGIKGNNIPREVQKSPDVERFRGPTRSKLLLQSPPTEPSRLTIQEEDSYPFRVPLDETANPGSGKR